MIGVGLAWASILAMPYVILSSCIPQARGYLYGDLQFSLSPCHRSSMALWRLDRKTYLWHQPIYAIVLAGFCMICAAVSVLFVYDDGAIRIRQEKTGPAYTG